MRNASWLEAAFFAVVDILGVRTVPQEGSPLTQEKLALLEGLLQIAVDRGVRLSTQFLTDITICHGNLFGSVDSNARWNLLAKVIKLDTDVFLVPTHDARIPERERALRNPLLERLFDAMASAACHSSGSISDVERQIMQHILVPTIYALAKARALPTFFQLWRESLVKVYWKRLSQSDANIGSVLPIATFLEICLAAESFRGLLQKHLTDAQIESEIDRFSSPKSLKLEDATLLERSRQLADLFCLDFLFMNLSQDETTENLWYCGLKTCKLVLTRIEEGWWNDRHSWRLWRIFSHVYTFWPSDASRFWVSETAVQKTMLIGTELMKKAFHPKTKSDLRLEDCLHAQRAFQLHLAILQRYPQPSSVAPGIFLDIFKSGVGFLIDFLTQSSTPAREGDHSHDHLALASRQNEEFPVLIWAKTMVVFLSETLICHFPLVFLLGEPLLIFCLAKTDHLKATPRINASRAF